MVLVQRMILMVAALLLAPLASGEPSHELLTSLEANLCAPKPAGADKATEGAFCPDCAAGAVTKTSKDNLTVEDLTEFERMEMTFLAANDNFAAEQAKANLTDMKNSRDHWQKFVKELEHTITITEQLAKLSPLPSGHVKIESPGRFLKNVQGAVERPLHEARNLELRIAAVKEGYPELAAEFSQRLAAQTVELNKLIHLQTKLLSGGGSGRSWSGGVTLDRESYQLLKDLLQEQKERAQVQLVESKSQATQAAAAVHVIKASLEANKRLTSLPSAPTRTRLEALRVRAKSRLISLLQRPQFKDCGLTEGEILALAHYTGNGYINVNSALRRGTADIEGKKEQIQLIKSGLSKLKAYHGLVHRRADLPSEVLAQHQPGQVVDYKAFSSTSLRAWGVSHHRFVIHSKSGRYIAPFSNFYGELEILIAPAKFKVISRTELADGKIEFVMEELE